jgi:hypothetical protein
MKPLRTAVEQQVGPALAQAFERSQDSVEVRLETFPRYARRKTITRFVTLYELFKLVVGVKGSMIECGVFRGFSLMTWSHLSAVLEPANLTRRIYGFDSFEGFPSVTEHDHNLRQTPARGELHSNSYDELVRLIELYDQDRFLGHIDKVHLIKGNVAETIPRFVQENPHLVVSLLFLDVDLYEPTKIAIEQFWPRMPRGSVIALDQMDNPIWPGEARAVLDTIGVHNLELKRFEWDPYISYGIVR